MRHKAAKVASYDAVPSGALSLIELATGGSRLVRSGEGQKGEGCNSDSCIPSS